MRLKKLHRECHFCGTPAAAQDTLSEGHIVPFTFTVGCEAGHLYTVNSKTLEVEAHAGLSPIERVRARINGDVKVRY